MSGVKQLKCVECGHDMAVAMDPVEETFKGVSLVVDGLEYWRCNNCGEIIFDAENTKKYERAMVNAYASKMGLMSPDDIVKTRRKYGLKQKELEKALGVSTPSVSRWETGAVCQSKPVDNLLRIMRDHEDVAHELIARAGV